MFKEDLLKDLNIELTEEHLNQFKIYFNYLIEMNKVMNLTGITEEKDVYYKHFYDSVTIAQYIPLNSHICDMGAGAGFPSIPLKIIRPDIKVTILDALNKRVEFLNNLSKKLNLSNVEFVHCRIEEYAKGAQKKFDVVTARALGHMNLICELGIPMLKDQGLFIAMKGSSFETEIKESENAIKKLESKVLFTNTFALPYNYGDRAIIVLKKEKHISGFPRPYQKIIKKPL